MTTFAITNVFDLGHALVVMTEHGVKAVSFDTALSDYDRTAAESRLLQVVRAQYPEAKRGMLPRVVQLALEGIGGPVDLDIVGSDFQMRVWKALCGVPSGRTVQYRELAEMIGQPLATRAVAQACGENPLAILVPCHRAVGKYNQGGYKWGVERKRRLLHREGAKNGVMACQN